MKPLTRHYVNKNGLTPEQRETMIDAAAEALAEPNDRGTIAGILHNIADQLGDDELGWILYQLFTQDDDQ